MEYSA